MEVEYHPNFKKQYKKLSKKFQRQFIEKLKLFLVDPASPQLRNHPLKGRYGGYWSINVNGDVRALYFLQDESIIIFALIGTHSELYG
ncbi:type II toxin-antitoxin system mRNA interferase toxin, RelE/StbE family [Patescibacteria group bacterium]|nr:type II toxin-antitoxin system mRNA interferase toxin, RelE/StbE family [Patescibacteria group bacterium]